MVAAISLQVINPFHTGKLVLFQVIFKRDWHFFELPAIIGLGMLGGIYGAFFNRMNIKVQSLRKTSLWLKNNPITEIALLALLTLTISYPFNCLRSNNAELVLNLFRECSEVDEDFHGLCNDSQFYSTIFSLLFTALIKMILTIFTFGSGVPAGVL